MLKYNARFLFVHLFLLSALSCLDVTSATENDMPLKVGHNVGGLTMNILYCYSCGYKKAFEDYANLIQQKYPDISVFGANYEPPGINMHLSRFIGIAKMLLITCIMSGFNIFNVFNKPQPSWWQWCVNNKMYSCAMFFFLCNTIEGQLMSSGAFEIFLNDMPVWSKLETGRVPQPPELFQIIDNTQRLFNVDDSVKSGYVK